MASDLSVLLQIQELDQRNDQLTKEIDDLPKHIAKIQARLESHRVALAKTQAILAENGKERRHLEGQIADQKAKISKLQDQMAGARTNEQFRAFQHEIQFCKDRIDECEEQILEKMEEAEELQANVASAEMDLNAEEAKVAADVQRANSRISADRQEQEEKRAERGGLVHQVPDATMRTYERIRRARGRAVSAVVGENCGACHVRVRPKFLQDLRHIKDGVLTCESCGLILYLQHAPDDSVPVEDPAAELAPTPRGLMGNPAALSILGEDEKLFFDSVIDFAEQEISPHVREMDEASELRSDVISQLFEYGLMGIEVPEEYGGQGGTFFDAVLAVQALSRIDPSVSVVVDVQNTLVANAILRWANETQKQKYLPRLCKNVVCSYALSEAGSGSDAFAMQTRADQLGDGYVLNGRKLWITNAKEAGLFLVFANAEPGAGHRGITAFLVEKDFPGFAVGKKERKLGIRASSTCELLFDNCQVPLENVLGDVGKGYRIAIETLNEGRIAIGAQMVGIAEGALLHALGYLREREQFGKRLADFQGIQFQAADLVTQLEAARLLVWNAARLKDMGSDFLPSAAMAKYYASEMAVQVTAKCVDFFGGVGYTEDYPVAKLYRDAKIGTIYEGTSNMQLQTIAKQLLQT